MYSCHDLVAYQRGEHGVLTKERSWAQIPFTNVVIYSFGPTAMFLKLSFPRQNGEMERDSYVCQPLYTAELSDGRVFVFSPFDDLQFCHEVSFGVSSLEPDSFRGALVFRWLSEFSLKHCIDGHLI